MPSTFTNSKAGFEKQATGENDNTWGDLLNAVIEGVDNIAADRLAKSVAGGSDVTLTAAEAVFAYHEYSGALTASINVIVPSVTGFYEVFNNTSGDFKLTVKTSAGTGIVVPQGTTMLLYCNATNVVKTRSLAGAANDDSDDITATYDIKAADHGKVLQLDASGGAFTSTLPDPANEIPEGWYVICKRTNSGANLPTIQRAGSATVDGANSITLNQQYDAVLLRCDGTNFDAFWMLNGSNVARLSANTFTADQVIQSTDDGATAGPSLTLWRNSASPAADDELGQLPFDGEDADGNQTTYAKAKARIVDPTSGSEDGALDIETIVAGTETRSARFEKGLLLGTAIGDDKGASSANLKALFGNGAFVFVGARFGATISNGTDADHDIDIAAGCVADSTDTELLPVTASTIEIDNASHRVDSSTLDPDTYYHILVGLNGTTPVAGFSKADALPSGWDKYRRIWSVRTDGSSNIPGLTTIGNFMLLDDPLLVVNETVGTTAELHQVGPAARTKARITVQMSTAANRACYLSTPDQNDTAASLTAGVATQGILPADAGAGVENNRWAHTSEVLTDTSGQVRVRQDGNGNLRMYLLGWEELAA